MAMAGLSVPLPVGVDRDRMAADLLTPWNEGRVPRGAYRKWQGPHWTLTSLAQIGFRGDVALGPLLVQVHRWLTGPAFFRPPSTAVLPGQPDRVRHCASMEGNAIWYSVALGLADETTDDLVVRLADWQWPDGGWNCDKRPEAAVSSMQETLIPLRGLVWYAASGRPHAALARRTVDAAAEYVLARRVLWRRRDGCPIDPDWGGNPLSIHYPIRFYDVLFALLVLAEAGRLEDPRCADALDLLQGKRLPSGGFPAELRTATRSDSIRSRGTFADWGPMGRRSANPFVTAEAESVLTRAHRPPERPGAVASAGGAGSVRGRVV